VAELRARARKGVGHSSHFRGVSLLRATGRWHAQINAAGQQVLNQPRAHTLSFQQQDIVVYPTRGLLPFTAQSVLRQTWLYA
jgi:hypothetical protein